MVCYFISLLNSLPSLRDFFTKRRLADEMEMGHIMFSSSACTHNVCRNQNVLFIHILLWKLMLKYFIAKHCENAGANIHEQREEKNIWRILFHLRFIFPKRCLRCSFTRKILSIKRSNIWRQRQECIFSSLRFLFRKHGEVSSFRAIMSGSCFSRFSEKFFEVLLQRNYIFPVVLTPVSPLMPDKRKLSRHRFLFGERKTSRGMYFLINWLMILIE